jgi:hypothetical protein
MMCLNVFIAVGAYSGVSNFSKFLKLDHNEDVPRARIYKILKTIPNYVYQLRAPRNYTTRSYQVDSFGKLLELDLAFMAPFNVSCLITTLH